MKMRIASVTFYDPATQKGGGSVPAEAFKQWMTWLGVDCEFIYQSDNQSDKSPEYINNNFDYAFFNTPPLYKDQFDYHGLKIPFAVMIHQEHDYDKYLHSIDIFKHPMCKVLVNIDHDGDYYRYMHPHRVMWHPCCRMEYFRRPQLPNYKEGLLYSGRITHWKNAHLFDQLRSSSFEMSGHIMGRIDDHSYARKHNIESEEYSEIGIEYGKYDVFWSVNGNKCDNMIVKRLDLSAFEAISGGLMPIVNPNGIPNDLRGIFIEVDPLNFDVVDLCEDIKHYRLLKPLYWRRMRERLENSFASFSSIEESIKIILEKLAR